MPISEIEDPFLSTAQVADLAAVVPSTVNRWVKSGELPVAQKLPGKVGANLFRQSVVTEFLARRQTSVA
jgi:predicted DNA-binding transcriptional regulator AlpA